MINIRSILKLAENDGYMDAKSGDDRWNNGTCECGGVYELSAASQYRTSRSFYYTCDTCGHTEEFSHLMK